MILETICSSGRLSSVEGKSSAIAALKIYLSQCLGESLSDN